MKKKQQRCYIYTRVSTSMQVDGYSLEAQKDRLHKYADYQEMVIVGEYSDEGKSGKSVVGRPEFIQMLNDIETGKDNIDFVLVFKLSRFAPRREFKTIIYDTTQWCHIRYGIVCSTFTR